MIDPNGKKARDMLMRTTLEAIYEAGRLRLLGKLSLPEHTRVLVSVETQGDDPERKIWLAASERSLMKVWDNDADDVYNELLTGCLPHPQAGR